jgi:hypothetical protein
MLDLGIAPKFRRLCPSTLVSQGPGRLTGQPHAVAFRQQQLPQLRAALRRKHVSVLLAASSQVAYRSAKQRSDT